MYESHVAFCTSLQSETTSTRQSNIESFISGLDLNEIEYASKVLKKRQAEIHYSLVKEHLNSIMQNKEHGNYEELGEGITLEDGKPLSRNDIEQYAKKNGIKLRTKQDQIDSLIWDCCAFMNSQPRF